MGHEDFRQLWVPKTLIEFTAETNFHRLQKEAMKKEGDAKEVEDACLTGVRQADREFNVGLAEKVGNRCYHERWADLTRPVYRQGPPPSAAATPE